MTRDEVLASVRLAGHGLKKLTDVYRRRRQPFILNHLVTLQCNLKCPFCYVSGPEQIEFNKIHYPKKNEMTTAEVRDFYQQLVANGFRLAVLVGGEPLLRKDLDDLLSEFEGNIFSTVFTNGLLLSERLELLRKAASLFVSLDAPDEEHDTLRNRKGCFRKAVEGIDAVRGRLPKTKVAIMMTVTSQNVHRVRDMIRFAKEMDLPVGFQPPTYEGQFGMEDRPVTDGSVRIPRADLAADAFRAVQEASGNQRILASGAFYNHIIQDRRSFPCHYPAYVLGPVYANGDIIACTSARVIANLRETRVSEILSGRPFWENADAGPGCPRGCRDWGIYDISAIHNREMRLTDLRRYTRAFVI